MERTESDRGIEQRRVVTCRACGVGLSREEAEAARWRYWTEERGGAFPLCAACARKRFDEG